MEGQAKEELKRKEAAEAHLYTVMKVARNEDFREQIGKELYFDLVNHDKVPSFRILRRESFIEFKKKVAKEFGVAVQFQRFWIWAKRQNSTYRPFRPLTPLEEIQPAGQLREVSNKPNEKELKLFLEVELDSDSQPIAPPVKTTEDILLFFKLYDPLKEELRYVGRLFVKLSGKPNAILTKLNEMAGFRRNEEIELYEEIKFEPRVLCVPVNKDVTFRDSQLQDGDIICFQKSQVVIREQCRYPNVRSFLEYIREHGGNIVKAQQEPKPDGSQAITPNAHVSELPPTLGNLTQEQSTQVAVPSTTIAERREQVTPTANDAKEEAKRTDIPSAPFIVDAPTVQPSQKPTTPVETTIDSSSLAFIDALFADIQNLLERKTSEANTLSGFQPSAVNSINEIANAKKIFKQCLDMKFANVIKSARIIEFKNSVSILLTFNAFPNSMVDKITKFLNEFDKNCEGYIRAEQELTEAEQKENTMNELKTTLKKLSSEFMPIRNQANQVNQEIADLERQLAEKKKEKAQLRNNLEDLARQATTSKQDFINAEQETRLFKPKKEEAKKMVGEMEMSWQAFKNDCSLILL